MHLDQGSDFYAGCSDKNLDLEFRSLSIFSMHLIFWRVYKLDPGHKESTEISFLLHGSLVEFHLGLLLGHQHGEVGM